MWVRIGTRTNDRDIKSEFCMITIALEIAAFAEKLKA